MLEATLLKLEHSGEINAKKAQPYLFGNHIYSPENAIGTESFAVIDEGWWEEGLSFKKSFKQLPTFGLYRPHTFGYEIHNFAFERSLFLWRLERFNLGKAKELKDVEKELNKKVKNYLNELAQGHICESLELMRHAATDLINMLVLRDREVARNLREAESRIRERYSPLKDINPLKLVSWIGAAHCPEKFYPELKIIQVGEISYRPRLYINYLNSRKQSKTFDESKDFLIKMLLHYLCLSEEQIESFSGSSELYAALKNTVADRINSRFFIDTK